MVVKPIICGPSLEEDPHLFCVKIVSVFSDINGVFNLMVKALLDFGGLRLQELGTKLVNMGCDGSSVL
jgi:hypothetical protein